MNIWRRGPLGKNPYARTVFRIARVERDKTKRKTIVKLIGRVKKIVKRDPRAHLIQGETVDEADINMAEKIILDPEARVVEELLEHLPEKLPLQRVRALITEAAEAMEAMAGAGAGDPDPWALLPWTREIAAAYIKENALPAPPLGHLELAVPPPFGNSERP